MIRLTEVSVEGYRALADFHAELGPLTVIIGPNACGKSTLLDALALASEGAERGSVTDPIWDRGGMESILWRGGTPWVSLRFSLQADDPPPGPEFYYKFAVGRDGQVRSEHLANSGPHRGPYDPFSFLERTGDKGSVKSLETGVESYFVESVKPHEVALSRMGHPKEFKELDTVARYFASWRFYLGFDVGGDARMRQAYKLGSDRTRDEFLAPDGRNLAAMISRLRSTASLTDSFAELEDMCRAGFPEDFKSVGTRRSATGAEELIEWVESRGWVFHAGELSDGILRFLCLAVLCAAPHPPPLVGIDEPEVGLHPGLLPIVADMLKGLAERTQVIVLTHSPELLNGFELDDIAVMTKDESGCHLHRPADRGQLRYLLGPTVGETMGGLHMSGELEIPPERTEAPAPLDGGHE